MTHQSFRANPDTVAQIDQTIQALEGYAATDYIFPESPLIQDYLACGRDLTAAQWPEVLAFYHGQNDVRKKVDLIHRRCQYKGDPTTKEVYRDDAGEDYTYEAVNRALHLQTYGRLADHLRHLRAYITGEPTAPGDEASAPQVVELTFTPGAEAIPAKPIPEVPTPDGGDPALNFDDVGGEDRYAHHHRRKKSAPTVDEDRNC